MNKIKQLCKNSGIRQAELAERLGYHPQYISNLARGRMKITYQFVARIRESYGEEAAALFLPHVGSTLPKSSNLLATQ